MHGRRDYPSQVIMPFLGSNIGGSHVASFALGDVLSADYNIECTVLCPTPSFIAEEARKRHFSVVSSGDHPTYRHPLSYDLRRLPGRIGILHRFRSRHAVLHCNDIQALKSWGPAAKLHKIPVIYHHRALHVMTFLKRRVLSLADYAICVSDVCLDNLSCVARRKVVLDPVTIADAGGVRARDSLVEELDLDHGVRLVGFVANFFHRKRPFFFLDVCAQLVRQVNDVHGIVFGRSRELEEGKLRAYADSIRLAGRVTFAGFRLPPTRNIAALDVLIAPAVNEPFGLTLVEALLLGIPYVATASAGHVEIHRRWRGGELVGERASPDEFASVVMDILRHPDRLTAQALRTKAQQDLSPTRHADEVMGIYKSVAADRTLPTLAANS